MRNDTTLRKRALWLVSLPLILVAVMGLFAYLSSFLGEIETGSLRFYLTALSYAGLAMALTCLPAYLIGAAWYWWQVTKRTEAVHGSLYAIPIIAVLFCWFPSFLFTPLAGAHQKVQLFTLLAVTQLVLGYAWLFIVKNLFLRVRPL